MLNIKYMNKLAEKYLYCADLLDEYGYYKEAEIFDKFIKSAELEYTPSKRTPKWVTQDDPVEKAIFKGIGGGLEKFRGQFKNEKAREIATKAPFAAMDTAFAVQGGKAVKNIKGFAELARKNPGTAAKAEGFMAKIATKFPAAAKLVRFTPLIGILVSLYMSRREIAKYIDLISQGKFEQIWNDPEERANFISTCLLVIAGVLVSIPFPPIEALGVALFGASSLISLGKTGIDTYMSLSGEKDENKELINSLGDLDIDNLKINLAPDVLSVANQMEQIISKNPKIKNIDLFNLPQFSKINWISNPSTSELQAKRYSLAKYISLYRASKLTPKSKKLQTQNTTSPNLKSEFQSPEKGIGQQKSKIPQNNKYYIGYGYNAYDRTKDYQRALSALQHKLIEDNVSENNKTQIIKEFKDMF